MSKFEDLNYLPDFIVDKILSYLSLEDIFNVLLVSKKWSKYVGRNRCCMDRIRLVIEGWQDLEKITTDVLSQNSRNYSSIVLNNLYPNKKEFTYLKTQNWKNVRIQQMKFTSTTKFCEYLAQFGSNLEELEIEKIIISDEKPPANFLYLPKLKELRLKRVPTSAFQIFPRYSNLKVLYFDIPAFGTHTRSLIVNFFLNFHGACIEELMICRNSLYGLSADDISSIETTISSMSGSLKKLELIDWGNCHTFERLLNKLRVKHFTINFCSQCPKIEDIRGLVPNKDLKILELTMFHDPQVNWCKKMFQLTPSLEYLFINTIRKEIVHHAALLLPNLKVFSYISCVVDVRSVETNATDEYDEVEILDVEEEDPGDDYDFIGEKEVFDIDGNYPTQSLVIERYSDQKLSKSFANLYYNNIRHLPSFNQNIKIKKCSKFNGFKSTV